MRTYREVKAIAEATGKGSTERPALRIGAAEEAANLAVLRDGVALGDERAMVRTGNEIDSYANELRILGRTDAADAMAAFGEKMMGRAIERRDEHDKSKRTTSD